MTQTPQTLVVVGIAESGRAAAELALTKGYRVIGMDTRTEVRPIDGVELMLGPHDREVLLAAERVVVSPGVPMTQPDILAAREAGVDVVSELGFAASFLDIPILAITGTNGKSTVTSFVGQLLEMAGRKSFVGGNLGTPLSRAVDEDFDVAVVEVSSYQLELPGKFAPQVGVILNLTPDHLGRHGTMEVYAKTKCEILRQIPETGLALLPAGNRELANAASEVYDGPVLWLGARPGVTREGNQVYIDLGMQSWHFSLVDFHILGEHNKENAATAAALCLAFGLSGRTIQKGIPKLKGLPHRMEVVSNANGVLWINDSKATNVAATLVGLKGLGRPAVVLLGGQSKGKGFCDLVDCLKQQRAVISFGGSGAEIAAELSEHNIDCEVRSTMEEAIDFATTLAQSGDVVLLSPGCASFDAYDNFEHRGNVFRTYVTALGEG